MTVDTPIGTLPDVPEAVSEPENLAFKTITSYEEWQAWLVAPNYRDRRVTYWPSNRWYGHLSANSTEEEVKRLLKKYSFVPSPNRLRADERYITFRLQTSKFSFQARHRDVSDLTRAERSLNELNSRLATYREYVESHELALVESQERVDALRAMPKVRRKLGAPVAELAAALSGMREDILDVQPGEGVLKVLFAPVLFPTSSELDQIPGGWAVTTPMWMDVQVQHPYLVGGNDSALGHPHFAAGNSCIGTAERDLRKLAAENDVKGVVGLMAELRRGWNPSSELSREWNEIAWSTWQVAAKGERIEEFASWDHETYQDAYSGEWVKWPDAFGLARDDWTDGFIDFVAHVGSYQKVVYLEPLLEEWNVWLAGAEEREAAAKVEATKLIPNCVFCNGLTERLSCSCHSLDDSISWTNCTACGRDVLQCACLVAVSDELVENLRGWQNWFPFANPDNKFTCSRCLAQPNILMRMVSFEGNTMRRSGTMVRCPQCTGCLDSIGFEEVNNYVANRGK